MLSSNHPDAIPILLREKSTSLQMKLTAFSQRSPTTLNWYDPLV